MSEYDHSHVRLRFVKGLFLFCALPPVFVALVLQRTETDLGILTIPSYFASVFLVAFIRIIYADHVQARDAQKLGARQIPRVVGKWPGSVDIIIRLLADMKSGYMHDVFLELFHEYQSTTLNLRILWTEKVCVGFRGWRYTDMFLDYQYGPGAYEVYILDRVSTLLAG
jgi:hypothetical protein